jgi:hypothetical protein
MSIQENEIHFKGCKREMRTFDVYALRNIAMRVGMYVKC